MIESPRPARPSEYQSLLRLINSTLFAGSDTRGLEEIYPGHLARSNLANLWVMVENGAVVSHVGVAKGALSIRGVRLPVVYMGSVCTAPKYRGLGLASRMIDHIRRRHDGEGFDLYLISGDRDLYRRIGGARAGRAIRYVLPRAALKPFGHPDVVVRPAEPEDLKVMAALYHREPDRMVRPPGIFRLIYRTGWAAFRPARFYVAEVDGEVTAYFVAGVTGKLAGPPRSHRLSVIEAAGSRTDLMAALHAACGKWNKRRIELCVSWADRDTLALLSGRQLAEVRAPVYDCTAIINVARLVQRLRPLLVARAGRVARRLIGLERQGRMELRLGANRLALKPEAMARLIFGEPERDRPLGLHPHGALGRVVRAAFPVPLADPGISYM